MLWLVIAVAVGSIAVLCALVYLGLYLSFHRKCPNATASIIVPHNNTNATCPEFIEYSATRLAHLVRTRQLSSRQVVQAFIDQLVRANAVINAVCATRFEDALREASEADATIERLYDHEATAQVMTSEFREDWQIDELVTRQLPAFFGVPCTIKESFAVQGLPLTAGLYSRKHEIATDDAVTVTRMKAAGFIVIAVSNVPEMLMWFETYNTLYGRSLNPYDLTRTGMCMWPTPSASASAN
jgi:fatty acid amide hydrolase 2